MTNMTPEDLRTATRCTQTNAALYAPLFERIMPDYGIDTPQRQAAFIAQIGHESGCLRYTRELWGPTDTQLRYENRKDLGNTEKGDGSKFRGRGLIQITGRANYRDFFKHCGDEALTNVPQLLEMPVYAVKSACWFWENHGLNELADAGDFAKITKIINGGTNGAEDRNDRYELCKKVFKC